MIYIGKHVTTNIDDEYFGSGTYIKAAQNKHGLQHFKKEILFELQNEDEMNLLERLVVNEEFIKRDDVYNMIVGSYDLTEYEKIKYNLITENDNININININELEQTLNRLSKELGQIYKGNITGNKNSIDINKYTDIQNVNDVIKSEIIKPKIVKRNIPIETKILYDKKSNKMVEKVNYHGIYMSFSELSRISGIYTNAIRSRVKYLNWEIDDAIRIPVRSEYSG